MSAPPLRTCVRDNRLICPDDLCRNSTTTLCGLEEGIDFNVEDDFYDDEEDYDR